MKERGNIKMSYNLRAKNKSNSPKAPQFHNYAFSSSSQTEKSFMPVTNINDLKRITPRVKVLNQETPTLQSLKKLNPADKSSETSPEKIDEPEYVDEETRNKMRKYCRTCAEVKYPLVDIFSEKGTQMRLNMQIKHLQQIHKNDSLTTQMCMDCICDLKMSFTFFIQIKKAEMKLRAIQSKLIKDNVKMCVDTKLPLIQHDVTNLKNNGPRISAVFSTDSADWEKSKNPGITKDGSMISSSGSLLPKDQKRDESSKMIKSEPKSNANDSDSIEEFDPDDPESDDDDNSENVLNPFQKTPEKTEKISPEKETPLKRKEIGKMRKFNVNDALSIKQEENGVMYVTVRGEKPNELLLVKVKKMDKEKPKDKPKKEPRDTLFVDRDLEQKGQIIEHQIEQYKKKRDKLLGPGINEIIPESRIKKEIENESRIAQDISIKLKEPGEIKKEKSPKPQRCKDKKMPVDVKIYTNAEDYNSRIESVKSKLEDKQRKDWEEVNPGTESPMDRVKRVLGDLARDENLHEFLDNLQQRKMIIGKLSDEDVVSLFESRVAGRVVAKEEDPPVVDDQVPCPESVECDFCFSEFPSREVCDEHMKFHDSKIQYVCEDCNEEFSILRYKKNHNVICIRKLICKYCDLMLDSKGKKKQHEQKHCDSLFGQLCEYCGEKFKHQGTLDQHVKSKHLTLEKTFQCPKCPKKFTFKTKLSFHLKSVHTAMRAYLCEDCGADFKNPASLRHHRIRKHLPTGNKRECPVCRKMIPFYSLSKHMHTHKAYTIKCPHCDKMFKNSSTLKQHVRIHEDQRQFRCDTCGVGFNRRDGLRLHMKVHEKADSRGLKECSCQVCGEKFPNHSMLVIHRNRIHKDGRNFTCHICNRSMISTRSLEWHLAHIHNEPLPGVVKAETIIGSDSSRRVACFHCHKTFKTEMILRTHIKNSHMEKEPVKCLDCDETFVSEVRLRHHMMVAHNRLEGTLACPHCPKRFVNQLRLKTHMIAHSEERPFRCDICGFNLKTKIQLIKHHQNRHSDERPLQCRYCPWRCKQVSALVCHERTHTNERPYSCSVCRQRFKYLGDKNKHERRHESLGGSGFKRIVTNRGPKKIKTQKEDDDTSISDQEHEMLEEHMEEQMEEQMDEEEMEAMEMEARLVDAAYEAEEGVKIEGNVIDDADEYGDYEQEYEESSKEENEVIMNMEETSVYTEEVTAENIEGIETTQIIEDEMMANQLLQSGTVVHIEQHDEEGKIQMIPVVLSLPDLTGENSEVDLATTSIMYNNEEEEEEE